MIYLLDTNMVSYIVKGRSLAASGRLVALPSTDVAAVSAITVGEIKYGFAKRPEATALRSLMEAFLISIRVLRWGADEADAYGTVKVTLEKQGITLGNMDKAPATGGCRGTGLALAAVLVSLIWPRTQDFVTRIWCKSKSTFFQISAISSDLRSPVVPASMTMTSSRCGSSPSGR